jgi:hypothetical protein
MIVRPVSDISYFTSEFGFIDPPISFSYTWHPKQKQTQFSTAITFVGQFYDCTVHSTPPLLITNDKLMVTDHVWPLLYQTKYKPKKTHKLWSTWSDKIDINLPAVHKNYNAQNTYVWMPIDPQSCNNPWHVWIDVISKLRLVAEIKQKHMFDYVYVFPCMSIYLKKVLKEIFPHLKYLVMEKNTAWQFKHIIVPSMSNRDDGVTHPRIIDWLRHFGPAKATPNRKIFITRTDALTRQLVNQDELLLALAGFEPVELSRYTVKEQMEIFDSASHVVATHGAGLTNLLWCQHGTKIIEINHIEQIEKKVYPILSSNCGLIHKVLYGEKIKLEHKNKPKGIKRLNDMANIKIDVQEVLRHV